MIVTTYQTKLFYPIKAHEADKLVQAHEQDQLSCELQIFQFCERNYRKKKRKITKGNSLKMKKNTIKNNENAFQKYIYVKHCIFKINKKFTAHFLGVKAT